MFPTFERLLRRPAAVLGACTLSVAMLLALPATVRAGEAAPASEDPVLEKRVMDIAAELRCLVCQNQTIADSHADLAVDLRNQVRDMLRKGQTQEQIVGYMTARYGDFVLYRPPLKQSTAMLWFGPVLLLLAGAVGLVVVLRRRARLPDDHFEADEEPGGEAPASNAAARPAP